MSKRLLAIAVIVTAFFLPLNVLAEDSPGSNGSTREERLSNAVAAQSLVFDDSTKALIQAKCQYAQAILATIQDQTESLIRKRQDTYSSIQKDLQTIKLRMIRQGADASETDLLTGKIQQSLDNFTLQADRYGVLLGDVTAVNCVQKPEQFKAGLVLTRQHRSKLLDSAATLKMTVSDSNDSVFKQLKERLKL